MSFLVRPTMNQPSGNGPDDIDRLFARFFQSEMPNPWPECPRPAASVRVAERVADVEPLPTRAVTWWELSQRFASRLALALSIALLLGTMWGLSGAFPVSTPMTAQPVTPEIVHHPIEILPPVAERGKFRVTEQLVQPKDGPTKMNIDIIEIVPPSPR